MRINNKTSRKLKGSVLAFTTLILVAITALISVIFLQSGMVIYFQSQVIKTGQIYEDIHIGIDYLLMGSDENQINTFDLSSLLNDPKNPVSVINQRWGFFEIVGAEKQDFHSNRTKMGFVGYSIPASGKVSLYLLDEGTPLNLCGKTHIEGNVYLPKQGVKRGYLAGMQYEGDRLVYGNLMESSSRMPEVFQDQLILLQKNTDFLISSSTQQFITLDDLLAQPFNSFTNSTKTLYDQSAIILSDLRCEGNFLIESELAIYIDKTAHLDNIIIKAPYVFIGEGFKGAIQCIASDSVFIDRNSTLEYPSVIALVTNDLPDFKYMVISDSSRVEGLVFIAASGQSKKSTLLSLNSGASVWGQVFCNGLFESKGNVVGSVICRRTILFTPSSIHENYLFNSSYTPITQKHFLNILPGIKAKGSKKILKWIS